MPQVLWTRYFLDAQGYPQDESELHQDNKSSILLEENRCKSSSKRTRHINIRYYFITDRIASGEIRVKYCPTKEMLADMFTKPLQGEPFRRFRNLIMNIPEADPKANHPWDHRSVLEETGTQEEWVTVKRDKNGRHQKGDVRDKTTVG